MLPGTALSTERAGREALITEAMRPSGTTGRWHNYIAAADAGAVKDALCRASA